MKGATKRGSEVSGRGWLLKVPQIMQNDRKDNDEDDGYDCSEQATCHLFDEQDAHHQRYQQSYIISEIIRM